jgi:hypothetical protein
MPARPPLQFLTAHPTCRANRTLAGLFTKLFDKYDHDHSGTLDGAELKKIGHDYVKRASMSIRASFAGDERFSRVSKQKGRISMLSRVSLRSRGTLHSFVRNQSSLVEIAEDPEQRA